MSLLPGDIGISMAASGWVPRAIAFFTKSRASHSFLIGEPWQGSVTVLESTTLCQVVPFSRNYTDAVGEEWIIFRPKQATEEERVLALFRTWLFYSGVGYAYLQYPWFIWRWFCELFGREMRSKANWASGGLLCSELCYEYLSLLGPKYRAALGDWLPNSVNAQDILGLMQKHPELFEVVDQRGEIR